VINQTITADIELLFVLCYCLLIHLELFISAIQKRRTSFY